MAKVLLSNGKFLKKENNTAAMNTTLSQIPMLFNFSEAQELEWLNMNSYYALILNIQNQNRTLHQLNESEKAQLMIWYEEEKDLVSTYARNILVYIGDVDYEEPYILPDMDKSTAVELAEQEILQSLEDFHYISVAPNPTADYTIVNYMLEESVSIAQLQITDLSGKLLSTQTLNQKQDQQLIDTRSYKTGIYLLSVIADGKVLETIQLIVTK